MYTISNQSKKSKSTAFKISFFAIKRGLPNILLHIMLFTPLFATRHFLYLHVTSFVNSKLNHRIEFTEIYSLEYKMLTVNFIYSFWYYYQISMHATILSRIYFKIFSVWNDFTLLYIIKISLPLILRIAKYIIALPTQTIVWKLQRCNIGIIYVRCTGLYLEIFFTSNISF